VGRPIGPQPPFQAAGPLESRSAGKNARPTGAYSARISTEFPAGSFT
jgi:hypothetical protein